MSLIKIFSANSLLNSVAKLGPSNGRLVIRSITGAQSVGKSSNSAEEKHEFEIETMLSPVGPATVIHLDRSSDLAVSFDAPIVNKVALITGGASGIGFHYGKELLRNGAKAIMIADQDEDVGKNAIESIADEFGSDRVAFIKTDVCNRLELENAFKRSKETYGVLDIVVNNAAVLDEKKWEKEIDVNCMGLARSTLLGLEHMGVDKGGKGGTIVNISSILAFQKPAGCPFHVATKYFAIGLSCSMGQSTNYERTGVKVLTLCPGITMGSTIKDLENRASDSEQGKLLLKEIGDLPIQPPEDVARGLVAIIQKGRPGSIWVCEDEMVYEVDRKVPDDIRTLGF